MNVRIFSYPVLMNAMQTIPHKSAELGAYLTLHIEVKVNLSIRLYE